MPILTFYHIGVSACTLIVHTYVRRYNVSSKRGPHRMYIQCATFVPLWDILGYLLLVIHMDVRGAKKMNCALNEHNFTGLGRSIKHIFAGFTLYNDSCRGKRRFPVLDLKLKKGHWVQYVRLICDHHCK